MTDRDWLIAAFTWIRAQPDFSDWKWLHDVEPAFLEHGPVVDMYPLEVWGKHKYHLLYVRHSWDGGSATLTIKIPKDLTP